MVRSRNPEKREQFLAAALRLFVEKGVHTTSTSEITTAAGTAVGTLFLYFPTKQDLIHALVLKIAQEQSQAVNDLLEPAFTAQQTFAAIWHGTLAWFMANPDAYRYILQVRDSGMISEAVAQESGQFFGYYFLAIQKGLAEGSIKPYPPELIGDILYHDLVSVTNLARSQPDPAKQTAYSQQGFEIFWNGIKNERHE